MCVEELAVYLLFFFSSALTFYNYWHGVYRNIGKFLKKTYFFIQPLETVVVSLKIIFSSILLQFLSNKYKFINIYCTITAGAVYFCKANFFGASSILVVLYFIFIILAVYF